MYKLVLALMFFTSNVLAQEKVEQNFKMGISYYQNGNMEDALYYLNKSLFKKENIATRYYLGLANLNKGELNSAKRHLSYAGDNDSAHYYRAIIEKMYGEYKSARQLFEKCDWRDAVGQARHCTILDTVKRVNARVKNINSINTIYSEVSPCLYNNSILFSSNREGVFMKRKDVVSNFNYYDFYESSIVNNRGYSKPEKSNLGLNDNYQHELQPIFNATFDTLYYCHSTRSKTELGKFTLPKLYRVTKNERGWRKPVDFLLNDSIAGFSHPHISKDGQLFFFSSNMPGGKGGIDLYVCYKQDTSWSYPINLGENINTPGDEISPFVQGDTLYFSSNGHPSFGGYDIFRVSLVDGLHGVPENVGKPINSIFNELYPVVLEDKKWLIVSDRPRGKGKEDIYEVTFYE